MKVQQLFMPVVATLWEHDDALADDNAPNPNVEDIPYTYHQPFPMPNVTISMRIWSPMNFISGRPKHMKLLMFWATTFNVECMNGISRNAMLWDSQLKPGHKTSFPRWKVTFELVWQKYTTTQEALGTLSSMGKVQTNWNLILKPLAKEDIWHPLEKVDEESDGKKEISWIWII